MVLFLFQINDLKKLQEALKSNKPNNPDLCAKLKGKYSEQFNLNQCFKRSRELRQDLLAQSLIPSDAPANLIARKCVGDGNCLFNAISLCLVGTTEYSTVLRILTAIEIFENAHYYQNHPRFREALGSGCPFGEVTVFTLALKEAGVAEWEHSCSRVSAVQSEAIGGCQLGEWSSLMHIMALATVICWPIFTIYPNCAEGIRPLLHGLVKPRDYMPGMVSDNDCFYILWSRDGGLDSRPNAVYVPNHFVPLFSEKEEEKISHKASHEPIKKASPVKRSFCLEDFWFPTAAKKKKKTQTCLNSKTMKMGDGRKTENKDKSSTIETEYKMETQIDHELKKKKEDELKLPLDQGFKMKDEKRMEDERNMENEAVIEVEKKMKNEMKKTHESRLNYEIKNEEENKIEERKMEKDKKSDSDAAEVQISQSKKYEMKRARSFQWKWLQAHPWVGIILFKKDSQQELVIPAPYPNAQPEGTAVTSMYCGVCSKHPNIASKESEFSKRSGSNNFKLEALKKHEASYNHGKCIAAEKAINDPKSTEMYKCCKQLYGKEDEKMEKSSKQRFTFPLWSGH